MHKRMIRALAVLLVFVASLFAKDKPYQPPSHPPRPAKATKFKSRKMKGSRTMKSRSTRPKTIKRKAPSKPKTTRRHTQNR